MSRLAFGIIENVYFCAGIGTYCDYYIILITMNTHIRKIMAISMVGYKLNWMFINNLIKPY